jgi:hypothetical protein
MQRVIEIALVITILVGAVFLWQSSATRSELDREHERLAAKVGRLPIKDPTKIHLMAMETGDPQHFAWRAYFPPNYQYSYSCNSGGGSGAIDSAWEGIVRVRVREVNGRLQLYDHLLQGSGLRSFGSGQVSKLLKEHPGQLKKLRAEQLGKDGLVIVDPNEVTTLIKLSLSDELLAEAKEQLNEEDYREASAPLEWIRIGPQGFQERETSNK